MSTTEDGATRATTDGYRLAASGPLADVGPVPTGTNVLVLGPPLSGKADLVTDIVTHGTDGGEAGLLVSPDDGFESFRDWQADTGGYVVDCSTLNGEGFDAERRVASVASPQDLTGIGMGVLKCMRAIGDGATPGLRVGVLSVSTLLQYTDPDRVFNFLHVLTGRISAAGYLGVFALDRTAHDETTTNKIKSQFDGAVRMGEGDDGAGFDVVGL